MAAFQLFRVSGLLLSAQQRRLDLWMDEAGLPPLPWPRYNLTALNASVLLAPATELDISSGISSSRLVTRSGTISLGPTIRGFPMLPKIWETIRFHAMSSTLFLPRKHRLWQRRSPRSNAHSQASTPTLMESILVDFLFLSPGSSRHCFRTTLSRMAKGSGTFALSLVLNWQPQS